ncbi:MAG: SAM-dependent methyltransferase [Lachnospiraceae bacterium]|nr:SAM-dependent methyltransferase [Lachnospiraceae bacterium]
MELSKRLSAVAALVSPCKKMADIGTDHGYIPIYLIERKKVSHALAMDINKGPLERAREHVTLHQLDEYIELRLSNGAEKLQPKEVDSVVIAGMGGRLMMKIIEERKEVFLSLEEFVIQPQSEYGAVRHFLEEQGFQILEENMVEEDGKYYPMMKVSQGEMKLLKECYYEYGSFLLEEKHPVLHEYLKKEQENYKKIRENLLAGTSEKQKMRLLEVEKILDINKEALTYFD